MHLQAFPHLNSQHTLVTNSVTCISTLESVETVHFMIIFFFYTSNKIAVFRIAIKWKPLAAVLALIKYIFTVLVYFPSFYGTAEPYF